PSGAGAWTRAIVAAGLDEWEEPRSTEQSRLLRRGDASVWRAGARTTGGRPREAPDELWARRLLSRGCGTLREARLAARRRGHQHHLPARPGLAQAAAELPRSRAQASRSTTVKRPIRP